MSKWVADCSKMPSESNCDLKITGSDKDAVIDAVHSHTVGSVHRHSPDEAGLRESIAAGLQEE